MDARAEEYEQKALEALKDRDTELAQVYATLAQVSATDTLTRVLEHVRA